MKIIIACLLLIIGTTAFSQKGISHMTDTEFQFAKMATDQNIKVAFLNFLDSEGVVFNNGKIQNGIAQWTSAKTSNAKLLWHPIHAGIAASGDLGFTTGPWIYKASAATDTVLASGFFTTIWHLSKDGKWKALADLGIECANDRYDQNTITTYSAVAADKTKSTDLMLVEKNFIGTYEKDGATAFTAFIGAGSWFNINGHLPFATKEDIIAKAIPLIPAGIKFIPVKAETAASNDIGYVYGVVQYKGKEQNYLRVWEHTKDGYKILLQVLNM